MTKDERKQFIALLICCVGCAMWGWIGHIAYRFFVYGETF